MSSEGSLRVKGCSQCGQVPHHEECQYWERLSNEAREDQDVPDDVVPGLSDCEDHEVELDHSSPLAKPRKGEKRPISLISEEALEDDWEVISEGDEEDEEPVLPFTPDLRWFFQQYRLDEPSQISICRTHANHLAAMSRVSRGKHTGAKHAGRPKSKK